MQAIPRTESFQINSGSTAGSMTISAMDEVVHSLASQHSQKHSEALLLSPVAIAPNNSSINISWLRDSSSLSPNHQHQPLLGSSTSTSMPWIPPPAEPTTPTANSIMQLDYDPSFLGLGPPVSSGCSTVVGSPLELSPQPSRGSSPNPSSSGRSIIGKDAPNFVHKLRGMISDRMYQHLISWNFAGTSFVVTNVNEFSKEVLPKHFKHNNFSSFVRQLNMYGFHKVNKLPRGSKNSDTIQFEFSHSKFLRERPDLTDLIKRKSLDSDVLRRENGDITASVQVMHMQQTDMMREFNSMKHLVQDVLRELQECRKRQAVHQSVIQRLVGYIHSNGRPIPPELDMELYERELSSKRIETPNIYIHPPPESQPQQSRHQQQSYSSLMQAFDSQINYTRTPQVSATSSLQPPSTPSPYFSPSPQSSRLSPCNTPTSQTSGGVSDSDVNTDGVGWPSLNGEYSGQ
ncbi:hypothetical protein SmJEL517_g03983 [Synchytrium microbalum]|uniref:HSF-type DNA-binding domain-containing protein n=1 Tax=Synchytrium microbalum TaxID=1806994 RepID=A0A507C6A0_9FUNG|nr:uncharacterized protein SmJEL517_g03983 [Synchytrium microbalum]TPX33005.1 hypothetical protein SmJEL517_g03983 [Synchytrium microbalum]